MYLIDPIPVTWANSMLTYSNVPYPDTGINVDPNNPSAPLVTWPRWVRGRGYTYDPYDPQYVVHHGALFRLWVTVPATDWGSSLLQLPPGHPDNSHTTGGAWERIATPADWSPSTEYPEGWLVTFPPCTYPTLFDETDPGLSMAERFDLAATPDFGAWAGYPSGIWRRNAVANDGESLLPRAPTLDSRYWSPMEPPLFDPLLEIPVGELTTYGGRIWRKRSAIMAAPEAPPSAPNDWALVKTANRFAMFDASVQSQTRQTRGSHWWPMYAAANEVIEVVLQATLNRIVDAVALLNIEATSVRVRVQSYVAGDVPESEWPVVYDRTTDMTTTAMVISNWYDWLFAPRHSQHSLVLDDIPPTATARVTITITNAGGQAACGVCLLGKRVELGATLLGLTLGIKDYSVKAEDDWGNVSVTPRGYSDRVSLPVSLPNDLVEPLKRTLIDYRARPALWVGSKSLPSTIVYGYYRAFSVTVPYPTESTYTLDLEGLA